jgi:hypothetical protein
VNILGKLGIFARKCRISCANLLKTGRETWWFRSSWDIPEGVLSKMDKKYKISSARNALFVDYMNNLR